MKTILTLIAAAALLLAGCNARVTIDSDFSCRVTADRSANIALGTAKVVRVVAEAGSLEIEGKSGLSEVRATGTACAADEDLLAQVQIQTRQIGDEVRIIAEVPDTIAPAALDLKLEVPDHVALKVEDASGETTIKHVGALEVSDNSGGLIIEDVQGAVRVSDDSGELTITQVTGNVTVSDDSGGMSIEDITGDVHVNEDGSGEITIERVSGSVTIDEDGSGGIYVRDVKGDFTVRDDGTGEITHEGVGGEVRLPSRD
jgi:hypothetical protein